MVLFQRCRGLAQALRQERNSTFENTKDALETLLLLSALLLSFAISGLQNLTHDDLVASDARYLDAWIFGGKTYWNQNISVVKGDLASYNLVCAINYSVSVQIIGLLIAMSLYASLIFSTAAENKQVFHSWIKFCKYIIAADFCLIIAGIVLLGMGVGFVLLPYMR